MSVEALTDGLSLLGETANLKMVLGLPSAFML